MKNKIILVLILLVVLLSSCTKITQKQAEAKALYFVRERVKFYSKDNSSVNILPYNFSSVKSYKEKNNWIVIVKVISAYNRSKETDVVIELDKKGRVVKFNNKPISYQ